MIDILMVIPFILPLLIGAAFCRVAGRWPNYRRFALPLAAGWLAGMVGNLVWGAYDMLASDPLSAFSWVDGFFVLREALHLFAFLQLASEPISRRQGVALCCAVLAAFVAVLVGCAGLDAAGRPISSEYWGGAIYPVLGVAVLGVALMRWQLVEDPGLHRTAGWVIAALLIYFAANLAQFISLVSGSSESSVALVLWLLSDLVALVAARTPTTSKA